MNLQELVRRTGCKLVADNVYRNYNENQFFGKGGIITLYDRKDSQAVVSIMANWRKLEARGGKPTQTDVYGATSVPIVVKVQKYYENDLHDELYKAHPDEVSGVFATFDTATVLGQPHFVKVTPLLGDVAREPTATDVAVFRLFLFNSGLISRLRPDTYDPKNLAYDVDGKLKMFDFDADVRDVPLPLNNDELKDELRLVDLRLQERIKVQLRDSDEVLNEYARKLSKRTRRTRTIDIGNQVELQPLLKNATDYPVRLGVVPGKGRGLIATERIEGNTVVAEFWGILIFTESLKDSPDVPPYAKDQIGQDTVNLKGDVSLVSLGVDGTLEPDTGREAWGRFANTPTTGSGEAVNAAIVRQTEGRQRWARIQTLASGVDAGQEILVSYSDFYSFEAQQPKAEINAPPVQVQPPVQQTQQPPLAMEPEQPQPPAVAEQPAKPKQAVTYSSLLEDVTSITKAKQYLSSLEKYVQRTGNTGASEFLRQRTLYMSALELRPSFITTGLTLEAYKSDLAQSAYFSEGIMAFSQITTYWAKLKAGLFDSNTEPRFLIFKLVMGKNQKNVLEARHGSFWGTSRKTVQKGDAEESQLFYATMRLLPKSAKVSQKWQSVFQMEQVLQQFAPLENRLYVDVQEWIKPTALDYNKLKDELSKEDYAYLEQYKLPNKKVLSVVRAPQNARLVVLFGVPVYNRGSEFNEDEPSAVLQEEYKFPVFYSDGQNVLLHTYKDKVDVGNALPDWDAVQLNNNGIVAFKNKQRLLLHSGSSDPIYQLSMPNENFCFSLSDRRLYVVRQEADFDIRAFSISSSNALSELVSIDNFSKNMQKLKANQAPRLLALAHYHTLIAALVIVDNDEGANSVYLFITDLLWGENATAVHYVTQQRQQSVVRNLATLTLNERFVYMALGNMPDEVYALDLAQFALQEIGDKIASDTPKTLLLPTKAEQAAKKAADEAKKSKAAATTTTKKSALFRVQDNPATSSTFRFMQIYPDGEEGNEESLVLRTDVEQNFVFSDDNGKAMLLKTGGGADEDERILQELYAALHEYNVQQLEDRVYLAHELEQQQLAKLEAGAEEEDDEDEETDDEFESFFAGDASDDEDEDIDVEEIELELRQVIEADRETLQLIRQLDANIQDVDRARNELAMKLTLLDKMLAEGYNEEELRQSLQLDEEKVFFYDYSRMGEAQLKVEQRRIKAQLKKSAEDVDNLVSQRRRLKATLTVAAEKKMTPAEKREAEKRLALRRLRAELGSLETEEDELELEREQLREELGRAVSNETVLQRERRLAAVRDELVSVKRELEEIPARRKRATETAFAYRDEVLQDKELRELVERVLLINL